MSKYGSILLQCQQNGSNKQYLVNFDELAGNGEIALCASYGPTGRLGHSRVIENEPTFFNKKAQALILSKLNKGYVVVEVNDVGYSGSTSGAISMFLSSRRSKDISVDKPVIQEKPAFKPTPFIFSEGVVSPIW